MKLFTILTAVAKKDNIIGNRKLLLAQRGVDLRERCMNTDGFREALLSIFLMLAGISTALAADEGDVGYRAELHRAAEVDELVMMPMRDGVRLATRIYRPKGKSNLPIIFWRTPYDFRELGGPQLQMALAAVQNGYAFVIQNERGRYLSEGEWEFLGRPRTDGYDALTWLSKQDWSNGRIGTLGCSSSAEWQLALAAMGHPAHKAAVPMAPMSGVGRMGGTYEQGSFFRGGAVQLFIPVWLYYMQQEDRPTFPEGLDAQKLLRLAGLYDLNVKKPEIDWRQRIWTLPIKSLYQGADGENGYFQSIIERKPHSSEWSEGGLYHDDEDFKVPALWFYSWFDHSITSGLKLYEHVTENASDENIRENQYLIIGPNIHCGFFGSSEDIEVGDRTFSGAGLDVRQIIIDWFDWRLKGENSARIKPRDRVRYFTMGADEWRSSDVWPPRGLAQKTLYLGSLSNANSMYGDGTLSTALSQYGRESDSFVYDPAFPVPTLGGGVCCLGGAADPGIFDQRPVEVRNDVLVYTSDPLTAPMEVSGYFDAVIYVSSDAKDTDFTIKLVDVAPDGVASNIADSILRVRYREGFDREVFMRPGEVYELRFESLTTSTVFEAGHQLRIEISSSNFPHFDRNLNTGGDNINEKNGLPARNTVHHSAKFPSRIIFSTQY